jgi:biotin operon repressor
MTDRTPTEERLAKEASALLRRISIGRSDEDNRHDAVQAAILVEQVLKDLRRGRSGREVILEMLSEASPEPVSIAKLRFGSGIQEFARRVRELRDEGHDIRSTGDGYVLTPPSGRSPVSR